MAQIIRFVDSIATSPTTRLNLHDLTTWTCERETKFPPPPRKRAFSQTLLTDGARVVADIYDNRVITLALALTTTGTADSQATQIQNLARELDRPNNILQWQPDTMTNPVFFRTFGSDVTDVVEHLQNFRRVTVEILAEPFAVGPRVDVSPVTVANNPASANGLFLDVTGVKGDVETPAIVRMPADAVYDATFKTSLFATRRRGTPANAPFLVQAESCTLGTAVTLPGADATMSGAGSNYARFTPTGTSSAVRLTTPAPTSNTDLRGLYRLLARYRKSVSGDTFTIQAKWSNGTIANSAVTLPAGTALRYVDLGMVQFPAGTDPIYDGYSNTEIAVSGTTTEIWAARTAGSGNLDVDFLLYVPADDSTCYVQWHSANQGTHEAVLDGTNRMAYLLDASDRVYNLTPSAISGAGFPMLAPGATNRIYFIRDVDTTATTADTISQTTAVTVQYYPRYLSLRSVTG